MSPGSTRLPLVTSRTASKLAPGLTFVRHAEPGQPLANEGAGVAGADRRLIGIAQDGAPWAALDRGKPRHPDTRREVVAIGLVARGPGGILLVDRRDARERPRHEEVAGPAPGSVTGTGAAARIGDRVRRVDAVIRPKRQLQLVAQPEIERQRRGDAKGILHEQPQLVLVRPAIRHAVGQILPGGRVERELGLDRRDATGQQAVEKPRVREVCVRGAWEIRRVEQPGGRVGGRRGAEARRRAPPAGLAAGL